jgi:hypothetical protein
MSGHAPSRGIIVGLPLAGTPRFVLGREVFNARRGREGQPYRGKG